MYICIKQQFSIGVNEVTRVLERMAAPCSEMGEASAEHVDTNPSKLQLPLVRLQVGFTSYDIIMKPIHFHE